MSYVYQHPDFGLGNFINLTPAISWLHRREGRRIPVFFSTDYVRQCFLDWKEVEILDVVPDGGPLFTSGLINPENDKPDYQHAFYVISGQHWHPQWHTYVDRPPLTKREREDWTGCIVVVNGAGSEAAHYVHSKDPGSVAFREEIKNARAQYPGSRVISVGSREDIVRNTWLTDVVDAGYFGNIRNALKIISVASLVIANDTGLAHAAGAMNRPLLVLMKNTPRERVKNPGAQTIYRFT